MSIFLNYLLEIKFLNNPRFNQEFALKKINLNHLE